MTPKEKAKELYKKFEMIDCGTNQDGEAWYLFEYCNPKQLALICVDEILSDMGSDIGYKFWSEVKTEIEKL